MQLSNEEARNALDFLAKKAGYEKFMFRQTGERRWIACGKNEFRLIEFKFLSWVDVDELGISRMHVFSFPEDGCYSQCLDEMLEVAKAGYATFFYLGINGSDDVFIEAGSTLEKLLVEMDLSRDVA